MYKNKKALKQYNNVQLNVKQKDNLFSMSNSCRNFVKKVTKIKKKVNT